MSPNEVWIPLSMFIGLSVVLSLWVWFRYKAKRDLQMTIRTAIEKGQGLSPELIENLVNYSRLYWARKMRYARC
jgi:hypothetical protein